MTTTKLDPENVWIYHERQEASLCGQHALNNLAQKPVFTAYQLAQIAHQLDELELSYMAQNDEGGTRSTDYQRRLAEGSGNVDAQGNFSIQVLKAALQQEYNLPLPHLSQDVLQQQKLTARSDITDFQGFLCHKSDHWFAIRKVGGRFWNLNSTLKVPVVVSHFQLATEMETWRGQGYTIFCVPSGLPTEGQKQKIAGGLKAEVHRMSDLVRGKPTEKDPWDSLSGRGMRLDGGGTGNALSRRNEGGNPISNGMVVDELTEEEQLQMALQASLEPISDANVPNAVASATLPVPSEPDTSAVGAVRIQFRLPDGSRRVRRFLDTDPMGVVFSYVREQSDGRAIDLRYGFPPRDLVLVHDQTIAEANLANESIQGRFV
jgi:ataxin-3